MGGSVNTGGSTTNQTQQQISNQNATSQTTPWGPAGSILTGLLGNLPTAVNGPGITNAVGALSNTPNVSPYVTDAYKQYLQTTQPFTDPTNLNPYNTPGFSQALNTTNQDITNQINQMFAGAGRDLSGANTQALARGLSQGEGALLANQYNTNVGNLLNTAQNQFGAGNTVAQALSGLNQTQITNLVNAGILPLNVLTQGAGVAMSPAQAFGTTNQSGSSSGYGTGTSVTQQQSPLWQQIAGGVLGTGAILGGNNGLLSFRK